MRVERVRAIPSSWPVSFTRHSAINIIILEWYARNLQNIQESEKVIIHFNRIGNYAMPQLNIDFHYDDSVKPEMMSLRYLLYIQVPAEFSQCNPETTKEVIVSKELLWRNPTNRRTCTIVQPLFESYYFIVL